MRKRTRKRESSTRKKERRRLIERGLKIACNNQLTHLSTCVKEQARERVGRKKQKKESYILDRESTRYKRHAIFYAHVLTQMLYVYVCRGGEESKSSKGDTRAQAPFLLHSTEHPQHPARQRSGSQHHLQKHLMQGQGCCAYTAAAGQQPRQHT